MLSQQYMNAVQHAAHLRMHCQSARRVFVLGQVQLGYAFASLLLPSLDVVERLQTRLDGMF